MLERYDVVSLMAIKAKFLRQATIFAAAVGTPSYLLTEVFSEARHDVLRLLTAFAFSMDTNRLKRRI